MTPGEYDVAILALVFIVGCLAVASELIERWRNRK